MLLQIRWWGARDVQEKNKKEDDVDCLVQEDAHFCFKYNKLADSDDWTFNTPDKVDFTY